MVEGMTNEWSITKLGDSSNLKARIGWQGLTTAEYLDSGDYFLITGTDFNNGRIDWYNCHYVSKQRYDQDKNIQIKLGDVLVTKDGTIGKVAYIDKIIKEATLNSGVFVIRPIDNAYNPEYFYHVLMSSVFSDFLNKLAAGSTISHLYQKDFINFKFLVPNLQEQKAIAKCFSDVDNMIQSLEKLIEKKKKIKQGTMQQLLTGKKRLPGFGCEWETKSLGEVIEGIYDYTANGSFESLKNNVKYYDKKNYAVLVRTTDLDKDEFFPERFTDEKGYNFLKKTSLFGDELIVANVGSIGKVFKVPKYDMPMTLASNTYLLTIKENTDKNYIYYMLNTKVFYDRMMEKIGSSTLKAINKDNLRSIIIDIPSSIKEQIAITKIIIDIDKEIDTLKQKKKKYNKIKQGMMQELLTGRIRLI